VLILSVVWLGSAAVILPYLLQVAKKVEQPLLKARHELSARAVDSGRQTTSVDISTDNDASK
jgi:hypothetical protein